MRDSGIFKVMVEKRSNIFNQKFKIDRKFRELLLNQNGLVLWFTGLSGSGKSTLASYISAVLHKQNILTYNLDGDNIRNGLNSDLGFSQSDRDENIRRVSEVAKLFIDSGIVVLASFISPLHLHRKNAKKIIGSENFYEIYLKTPLKTCVDRDVKGLYKLADEGKLENFTGITSDYEPPKNPFLSLDTTDISIENSAEKIIDKILNYIKK